MSNRRAAPARGAGGAARGGTPARRRTDPTMLVGQVRVLTAGSVVAAGLGVVLAALRSETSAPLAFTSSSVVAVGLLVAARRADTASRPDVRPDRTARTVRVLVAVLVLAVVGTVLSAWTIAGDLAR